MNPPRLGMNYPKTVHKWAANYRLGDADPELQALLTKTKTRCVK